MTRIETEPVTLDDGSVIYRPVINAQITIGKKSAIYQAIIDTGADASMVSADLVEALGAKWDKLTEPRLNIGAGGPFETRYCRGQIYYAGELITNGFRVAKEIVHEGHTLPLFLLGRTDFMKKFITVFHWEDDPAWIDMERAGTP